MLLRPNRLLTGAYLLAIAACGMQEVVEQAPIAGLSPVIQSPAGEFPAGALPAGEAREILVNECLNCHELDALELFKGFYTKDRWRSLVLTMRENGARVDDRQVEVLAEYLARHFGTGIE